MSAISSASSVGTTVSGCTNSQMNVVLGERGMQVPLVGQMVFMKSNVVIGDEVTTELGLGLLKQIETRNQYMDRLGGSAQRYEDDQLKQMTGQADLKVADVRLQAAYRRGTSEDDLTDGWRQAGSSLSTSPSTGTAVQEVNNDVIDELIPHRESHYVGHMAHAAARGAKIRLPLNMRDFSGSRGAYHTLVAGVTGAGKTVMSNYLMCSWVFKHPDMGAIVIDPQGQWAGEQDAPFSVQGFAQELGREVIVARVSEDLKLEQDANLLVTLLARTRFVQEAVGRMADENKEELLEEMAKALRDISDWPDEDSDALLVNLLNLVNQPEVRSRVYASPERQDRLEAALDDIIANPDRRRHALVYFRAMHNLFQSTNPNGQERIGLWATLQRVFDKNARQGRPAPLLIVDMSLSEQTWLETSVKDGDELDAARVREVLDSDEVKAAILIQAFGTLKRASEEAYRNSDNLNTVIVFDEAWRYAAPVPGGAGQDIGIVRTDPVARLSKLLGNYARDTRKFGIGWWLITQSPRSINPDIFAQITVGWYGYGLSGADLDRVAEQLDGGSDDLRLYKSFAPPDATDPKIYPYMAVGPVSPLAFTRAPTFVASYTDFDEFRVDNHWWIEQLCHDAGTAVMTGAPTKPARLTSVAEITKRSSGRVTSSQKKHLADNAQTGGVDMSGYTHLGDGGATSDGLASIDDDDIPF